MESIQEAWSRILHLLTDRNMISQVSVETWLSSLTPLRIEDGHIIFSVRTDFQRSIILECYIPVIEEGIRQVIGLPLKVSVLSDEDPEGTIIPAVPTPAADDGGEKKDTAPYEYSFSNFIVGSSNQYAHAACQAVANKPAQFYNPLFVYGGSGLGKTHLMYAIFNHVRSKNPAANIIYTKAETMTNEVIEAIRGGRMADVRAKYRCADLLLVDDIQFIAGKESTQDEFFHTFETLYQSNKQIVLTSDRLPKEIASLEDRLRYRFEMGLLADVQPPDLETRIAIIKGKAAILGLQLSDDIVEFIAHQLKINIRQIDGTVRRIFAHQLLAGEKPSIIVAQTAIRDIRNSDRPTPITIDRIISEVGHTLNVSTSDIRSKKQSAAVSLARQVAIYIVREVTSMPMKQIGAEFGNRDHSTVVHSIHKVQSQMESNSSFKGMVKDIIENISRQ